MAAAKMLSLAAAAALLACGAAAEGEELDWGTTVTNVVTRSTRCNGGAGYAPVEGLSPGQQIYCDRDYAFTRLPAFLRGTTLIQTANSDKHSGRGDPAEQQPDFVCFDVATEVTVYLLYDSRVDRSNKPTWLTAKFVGQHVSVAAVNDAGMGEMEVWVYNTAGAETVCLGGNDAPAHTGTRSNYVAAVGPLVDHSADLFNHELR